MANRCNWLRPLRRCSPNIRMPWLKRGERRGNSVKKTLQDITKELLRDIHLQWVFPFPAMCMKRMAALLPSNGCGHQTFFDTCWIGIPACYLVDLNPAWKQKLCFQPSGNNTVWTIQVMQCLARILPNIDASRSIYMGMVPGLKRNNRWKWFHWKQFWD